MKISYVTIGSTLSKFFRILALNRFSIHPKYFLRLFLIFQSAVWSSVFKIVEKIRYQKKIESSSNPRTPVFIIGHWRTGSTFLHQMMSLDENFVTPNVFQVTVPDCFISIEKYYKPLMKSLMDNKRPMDNVKFGPDAPQEDEFALFRLTLKSPLQRLVFPKKSAYFLTDDTDFVSAQPQSGAWEKAILYFYKKLTFQNNKQILIKNPFHSMRVKTLCRLFPDALFIHIYRNPLDVIPSTVRMWNIIAQQNCMNKKWQKPRTDEVVRLYKMMLQTIHNDLSFLEPQRYTEVKYEDLENDPIHVMRSIYNHLNLDYSTDLDHKIQNFLVEEKDYKKNVHQLSVEDSQIIVSELKDFMIRNHYLQE